MGTKSFYKLLFFASALIILFSCQNQEKKISTPVPEDQPLKPRAQSFYRAADDFRFANIVEAQKYLDTLLQKSYQFERELKDLLERNPSGNQEQVNKLLADGSEALISLRYTQETLYQLYDYMQSNEGKVVRADMREQLKDLSNGGFSINPTLENNGFMHAYANDIELRGENIDVHKAWLFICGTVTNNGDTLSINEIEQYIIPKYSGARLIISKSSM